MLCRSGMATMHELLDLNGVWTEELIALMIPVVIDGDADAATTQFGASAAAVSLIGGKQGAVAFEAGIKKSKTAAHNAMRAARGLLPVKPEQQLKKGETSADQFMGLMGQLGLKARVHKKRVPQPTRKHKR